MGSCSKDTEMPVAGSFRMWHASPCCHLTLSDLKLTLYAKASGSITELQAHSLLEATARQFMNFIATSKHLCMQAIAV